MSRGDRISWGGYRLKIAPHPATLAGSQSRRSAPFETFTAAKEPPIRNRRGLKRGPRGVWPWLTHMRCDGALWGGQSFIRAGWRWSITRCCCRMALVRTSMEVVCFGREGRESVVGVVATHPVHENGAGLHDTHPPPESRNDVSITAIRHPRSYCSGNTQCLEATTSAASAVTGTERTTKIVSTEIDVSARPASAGCPQAAPGQRPQRWRRTRQRWWRPRGPTGTGTILRRSV